MTINRWHLLVSGKVQGVYYRASTEQKAREWASQAGYEIYRTAGSKLWQRASHSSSRHCMNGVTKARNALWSMRLQPRNCPPLRNSLTSGPHIEQSS